MTCPFQLAHDMYALEGGYRKFVERHRAWMDKIMIVDVEKSTAIEQLQAAAEREKMLQEEISYVTVELQSSRAELRLTQ